MAWDATWAAEPAGTDAANTLDTEITSFKSGLISRMGNQHTTYDEDDTSGIASNDFLHKEGSAVLVYDNTAPGIDNETAQAGFLWYDTDNEALKVRTGSAWVTIYQKDPVGTIKYWDTSVGGAWVDSTADASWTDGTIPGWTKFVEGYDYFPLMKSTSGTTSDTNELSGGKVEVTLDANDLPEHTHSISASAHYHTLAATPVSATGLEDLTVPDGDYPYLASESTVVFGDSDYRLKGLSGSATKGKTGSTTSLPTSTGNNTTTGNDVDVTPPYYTLIPIIRRN